MKHGKRLHAQEDWQLTVGMALSSTGPTVAHLLTVRLSLGSSGHSQASSR